MQTFAPSGPFTPWHSSQTKALRAWKFGLPATPRSGCNRVRIFSKGSRGGTWRVNTWDVAPRDQRHRRCGALAHLLVSVPSGSASPIRSYWPKCLNTHTDWPTEGQTGRPTLQNAGPIRTSGNLHSENGLRPFSIISILNNVFQGRK